MFRLFIPFLIQKNSAVRLFASFYAVRAPRVPLFEEEINHLRAALFLNIIRPLFLHRSGFESAFAADNHLMNIRQINRAETFEQRFDGQKPDFSVNVSQRVNPVLFAFHFHRYAKPNIVGNSSCLKIRFQNPLALCQNLINMARRAANRLENPIQKLERHFFVKQIRHRINKKLRRLFHLHRRVQMVGQNLKIKRLFITRRTHRLQPLRHHFGATILTTRRNFIAAD